MLTGCWDATEIDQLAIVTATAVDVGDQGPTRVKGGFQIAVPSQLGTTQGGAPTDSTGNQKAYVVVEDTGNDPVQLVERARKKVSRKLIMSHRSAIIVGEDYAKRGLTPLLDEVVRNPESRLRTNFLVAYHDTGLHILELPYPLERLPSQAIDGLTRQLSQEKFTAKDFVENLVSKSDPYAVGIEASDLTGGGGSQKKDSFLIRHIAVFHNDKMVGWLEQGPELNGFFWLKGTVAGRLLTVDVPGQNGTIGSKVLKSKTISKVHVVGGKPQIYVEVDMRDDIVSNDTDLDLRNPKNIGIVEGAIENRTKHDITQTLNRLQHQLHADPIGFAEMIYTQQPKLWYAVKDNWRSTFSSLPVQVVVKVEVQRSGLATGMLTETKRGLTND